MYPQSQVIIIESTLRSEVFGKCVQHHRWDLATAILDAPYVPAGDNCLRPTPLLEHLGSFTVAVRADRQVPVLVHGPAQRVQYPERRETTRVYVVRHRRRCAEGTYSKQPDS